jgi:hypothetical protein
MWKDMRGTPEYNEGVPASLRRLPDLRLSEMMRCTNEHFFQVIGQISVFFSTWDLLTTLLIIRLAKRQTPLPALARQTLPQKLHFLRNLTPEKVVDPEVLDRIQSALPDALSVAEKRNRFIHDQWVFSPESVPVGEISLVSIEVAVGSEGRTIKMPTHKLRLDELHAFLETLGAQQKAFAMMLDRLPPSN